MNGINYPTALNSVQFSQNGVLSKLSPLLKAVAVIAVAFITIGAVYLAITQGIFRRQTHTQDQSTVDSTPTVNLSTTAQKIQITIQALQAKMFTMDVYPSDTIGHLQNQICEYYKKLNLDSNDPRCSNPAFHRLLFAGKNLEPERTLSDYKITDDKCMLFVVHGSCGW